MKNIFHVLKWLIIYNLKLIYILTYAPLLIYTYIIRYFRIIVFLSVLDEFNEKDRGNRKLVLLTPAGSIVPPHQMKDIVNQFKGCGCWSLKIMFTDSVQMVASALALVLYTFLAWNAKIYIFLCNVFFYFSV